MLNTMLKASGIAALLAIAVLALQLGTALPQWQRESAELAGALHAQSVAALETQAKVRDSLGRLDTAAASATKTVEGARGDLAKATIAVSADLRQDFRDAAAELAGGMTYGFGTVNYQLMQLQSIAAGELHEHLDRLNDSADAVAGPVGQVAEQVSAAAELSLDCDHNADCLHNRWVGTSRAVEKAAGSLELMGDAWGNAAPRQAEAVTRATENAAKITGFWSFGWMKFWRKKR